MGLRSPEIHRGHIWRVRWLRGRGRCRLRRPGSLLSTLGIGGNRGPGTHARPNIRLHAKACPAEHGGATGPGEAAPRPLSAPSPGRCPERGLVTKPFPQATSQPNRQLPQFHASAASSCLPPPPLLHDPATLSFPGTPCSPPSEGACTNSVINECRGMT